MCVCMCAVSAELMAIVCVDARYIALYYYNVALIISIYIYVASFSSVRI